MMGMSGCLTVLFVVVCFRGVLAPDAGGVLPAELSEDLFSTEHRRFRNPKLPGPGSAAFDIVRTGSGFFGCTSASICGSGVSFTGESDSWKTKIYMTDIKLCLGSFHICLHFS